jgi:hypothetical protein
MGLENFSAALDLLKGFQISLYVGEEVVKGKLLGVEADHIVIENEKNYIFYYSIDKVHAITKNTRLFKGEEIKGGFQRTKSLHELLESFQNSWVNILTLNKQKFSGVLSDVDADFATVINGEERILIKLAHISNILKGFIAEEEKKEEKKEEKQQAKSQEENNHQESKKSEDKNDDKTECKTEKHENNTSSKEMKKTIEPEAAEMPMEKPKNFHIESEDKLGWSEPIKEEVNVPPAVCEVKPESTKQQDKKSKETSKPTLKRLSEGKTVTVKKTEEKAVVKPKPVPPVKEVKPVIEEDMKVERITTTPMMKKEVKPTKMHEAVYVKSEVTTNPTVKSVSYNSEPSSNTNRNVWKPNQQEERTFRFAGEPVSRDAERSFPFAGWPNHKSKSSRNLFF